MESGLFQISKNLCGYNVNVNNLENHISMYVYTMYQPGAIQDNLPMSEDNYAMHGAGLQLNITLNHYMQLCASVIMISCACNELSRRMRRQLRKFPESGVSLTKSAWL